MPGFPGRSRHAERAGAPLVRPPTHCLVLGSRSIRRLRRMTWGRQGRDDEAGVVSPEKAGKPLAIGRSANERPESVVLVICRGRARAGEVSSACYVARGGAGRWGTPDTPCHWLVAPMSQGGHLRAPGGPATLASAPSWLIYGWPRPAQWAESVGRLAEGRLDAHCQGAETRSCCAHRGDS